MLDPEIPIQSFILAGKHLQEELYQQEKSNGAVQGNSARDRLVAMPEFEDLDKIAVGAEAALIIDSGELADPIQAGLTLGYVRAEGRVEDVEYVSLGRVGFLALVLSDVMPEQPMIALMRSDKRPGAEYEKVSVDHSNKQIRFPFGMIDCAHRLADSDKVQSKDRDSR